MGLDIVPGAEPYDFGPNAEIHGIDWNPRCKRHQSERIHIHIGHQEDVVFLNDKICPLGPFDVIIDDGGHKMHQQQISLINLWSVVSSHGIYVIEDLGTSYTEKYGGGYKKHNTTIEFLKAMLDKINTNRWYKKFNKEVHPMDDKIPEICSMEFYEFLCIIQKQPNPADISLL